MVRLILFSIGISRMLSLILIFSFLVSCGFNKNFSAPSLEGVTGFSSDGIRDGKLYFSFNTRLNNPSRRRVTIRRVEMDILVSGVRLAQINTTRKVKIKGILHPEVKWNASGEIKPLLASPGALLGSILKSKVKMEFNGNIVVSKFLAKKIIPVRYSLSADIPLQ